MKLNGIFALIIEIVFSGIIFICGALALDQFVGIVILLSAMYYAWLYWLYSHQKGVFTEDKFCLHKLRQPIKVSDLFFEICIILLPNVSNLYNLKIAAIYFTLGVISILLKSILTIRFQPVSLTITGDKIVFYDDLLNRKRSLKELNRITLDVPKHHLVLDSSTQLALTIPCRNFAQTDLLKLVKYCQINASSEIEISDNLKELFKKKETLNIENPESKI